MAFCLSDSEITQSYSASLDTYSIYNREGIRLSTISERTENIPSRPTSYGTRAITEGLRLSGIRNSSASPGHFYSRSAADLPPDRLSGRRTGDLIAFFEDRASTPSESSFSHSRTTSMPAYRSHTPFRPMVQSTPHLDYAPSTGYSSRSPSPAKNKVGSAISSASSFVSESFSMSSLLSPPTRGPTTTTQSGTQLSPSDFASTFSNTFTASRTATTSTNVTPSVSSLRRPQTSPRSPLTSVRNIVAAWKERTPAVTKMTQSSTESSTSPPPNGQGPNRNGFSLRRRARRSDSHLPEHVPNLEGTAENINGHPHLAASSSGIIPPPFDMTELGAYARESREVSCNAPNSSYWLILRE